MVFNIVGDTISSREKLFVKDDQGEIVVMAEFMPYANKMFITDQEGKELYVGEEDNQSVDSEYVIFDNCNEIIRVIKKQGLLKSSIVVKSSVCECSVEVNLSGKTMSIFEGTTKIVTGKTTGISHQIEIFDESRKEILLALVLGIRQAFYIH